MKKYALDYEEFIDVNGDRQNIRVRSTDASLPVALFLHGGPGVCNRHFVMKNNSRLADYCTIVCWDQRASGKSFRKEQLGQPLNVNMYVEDAAAVVDYLCRRFNKDKIYVIGHSWGTLIGTLLVQKHPERIAYYVGVGQLVDGFENERLSYQFCVDEAKRRGDKRALARLDGIAPVDGRYPSHKAMMTQRDYLTNYGGENYKHHSGMLTSLVIPLLTSREYSLPEIAKYAKGGFFTSDVLWDEVVSVHFLEEVKSLNVPVLITQGEHDFNTPTELAKRWFDALEAPSKKMILFSESAHSPLQEEPAKWNDVIISELFAPKQ